MTHDFAIPFDLLKPVLEKSNAKQLEHIENYSPVSVSLRSVCIDLRVNNFLKF